MVLKKYGIKKGNSLNIMNTKMDLDVENHILIMIKIKNCNILKNKLK